MTDTRWAAWVLYVQLTTRISTVPLPDGEGFARGALSSLHALFGITRDVLAHAPPPLTPDADCSVQTYAFRMLGVLRPFLTKWHTRLERHLAQAGADEDRWPDSVVFRTELRDLQAVLRDEYATAFFGFVGPPSAFTAEAKP